MSRDEGRRLGIELPPNLTMAEKVDLAVWGEQQGFDDIWVVEISDPEPFVMLTAIAAQTERVRLGTAIVPMGTRTVPLLASAAGSMSEISGGRFALGLGVSSKAILHGWHGIDPGRPLGRTRETVGLLRDVLAGGRSDVDGEYVRSKGFRLRRPPEEPPPIVLAAMNEKMLELAGEIADGVLLNFLSVDAVPLALDAVRRGMERAGRTETPELAMMVPCTVTDRPDEARRLFADAVAFYLSAPPYQRALTWYGWGEEVERAKAAWATGDIERVRSGVSDEFIDSLGAFGSAEHCHARLQEYWDAGIGTLSLSLAGEPFETLQHFAR